MTAQTRTHCFPHLFTPMSNAVLCTHTNTHTKHNSQGRFAEEKEDLQEADFSPSPHPVSLIWLISHPEPFRRQVAWLALPSPVVRESRLHPTWISPPSTTTSTSSREDATKRMCGLCVEVCVCVSHMPLFQQLEFSQIRPAHREMTKKVKGLDIYIYI